MEHAVLIANQLRNLSAEIKAAGEGRAVKDCGTNDALRTWSHALAKIADDIDGTSWPDRTGGVAPDASTTGHKFGHELMPEQ